LSKVSSDIQFLAEKMIQSQGSESGMEWV